VKAYLLVLPALVPEVMMHGETRSLKRKTKV